MLHSVEYEQGSSSDTFFSAKHFLSPRTLHFSSTQLFWECRNSVACEAYPFGMIDAMPSSRLSKSLSPYLISEQSASKELSGPCSSFPTTLHLSSGTTTPFHVWDAILLLYSTGALTHASDKFVAISGIARELAPRMGGRYLAGLWEVQMARQLLWIAAPTSKVHDSQHQPYRAPSWSWAATDQPLKMAMQWDYRGTRNKRDFLIDILRADIVPAKGNDAFGQITGAEIVVRGRLMKVGLTVRPTDGTGKESEHTSGKYRIVVDGSVLNEVTVFEDSELDNGIIEKFCLPISVSVSTPEGSLDRRTLVYGLLLQRCVKEDKYRRIGVFMAPNGEDFLISREMLEKDAKVARDIFDWRNCSQWHGESGRTFGKDVFILI